MGNNEQAKGTILGRWRIMFQLKTLKNSKEINTFLKCI